MSLNPTVQWKELPDAAVARVVKELSQFREDSAAMRRVCTRWRDLHDATLDSLCPSSRSIHDWATGFEGMIVVLGTCVRSTGPKLHFRRRALLVIAQVEFGYVVK